MRKLSALTIILIMSILLIIFACSDQKKQNLEETQNTIPLSSYQHQVTKDVVTLVHDAVDLIEKEGKESFKNFYDKDSKWFHDDTYIFVWGLDGMRYVYPRDPAGEGKNMLKLKDINGKPIGKMFVDAAKSTSGQGWVFYEWTIPGEEEPTWKSTFIKKAVTPDDEKFLVGYGKYNMPMEKIFVKYTVDKAAKLLDEKGKEVAFSAFNDQAGPFIFLDTYVYVKDMQGNELVNPMFPELVGKNIMNLQDANGNYFVKNEIEKLQEQDSCWYSYMWPKPGAEKPSQKTVYVKKVKLPQDTLVVGAGYYKD